jgi:heme oxygenase
LRSGQTLTQIAQARKVDVQSVKSATLTALKAQLSQAVSAGRLTQAQADQILAEAEQSPNFGLRAGRGGRGR